MRRTRGTRPGPLPAAIVTVLAVASGACDRATDIELLEIPEVGVLVGTAFLDLDASGTLNSPDRPLTGADVLLTTSAAGTIVETAATDTAGFFALFNVPLGSYRLTLAPQVLGDSLVVLAGGDSVTVAFADTSVVTLGASFATLTVPEVLTGPTGRRVFTGGIALASRPNFGDGQVHFEGDGAYLRALNVERGVIAPGDSVRLLGRVIEDNGRRALDEVSFDVLVPQAAIVTPVETSTGRAANADGGMLDAALIVIRSAEISDTSTTPQGHFRFWADDGTDSVEFVIRDFLLPTISKALFRPDTIVYVQRATGLLSPIQDGSGSVRWQLLPRSGSDIALALKLADVSVATAFDTTQASLGDTVEVSVVAANAGPEPATGVQVTDTLPAALTFLSAATTRGTYDAGARLWSIGDLESGEADTLRIRVEVIDGTPGTISNTARVVRLLLQVDLVPGNDAATAGLTIS